MTFVGIGFVAISLEAPREALGFGLALLVHASAAVVTQLSIPAALVGGTAWWVLAVVLAVGGVMAAEPVWRLTSANGSTAEEAQPIA